MSETGRTYYCLCNDNCRFETMTKEQILAAIANAIQTGEISDVDTGFITKIKDTNKGSYIDFWVGTTAEYNALTTYEKNRLYIKTDDNTYQTLIDAIVNNNSAVPAHNVAEDAHAELFAKKADKIRGLYNSNFSGILTMADNTRYTIDNVSSLTLDYPLNGSDEYTTNYDIRCHILVNTGESGATFSIVQNLTNPVTFYTPDGTIPDTLEANSRYEISVNCFDIIITKMEAVS